MDHSRLFRSKVKWLSLFLSVLVVFIHSTNTAGTDPDLFATRTENYITGNLAAAAVPTFYALSAFLFYRNFDMTKLAGKYKSRIKTLLIPFLLWNTVYMILFYFLSRLPFISEEPFAFTWSVIVNGVLKNRFNAPYWFMRQLILFTAFCPVIYAVMRNRYIAWTAYAGILLAYGCGVGNVAGIDVRSLLFYLFGAYCGLHLQKQVSEANRFSWWVPTAFVLSQLLFCSGLTQYNPALSWLHLMLLTVAYFGFANLVAEKELPKKLQCSFEIYTLHILILETFNKLFGKILPPNTNWLLLDYFLSPLLTVGIIVAVSQIAKRKIPRIYGIAFGGR